MSNKAKYAVARRILAPTEQGGQKETDELLYCENYEEAHALALQGLASGWAGVAIVELDEKVKKNE